jgi:outer membrane protein assembly factor BamB
MSTPVVHRGSVVFGSDAGVITVVRAADGAFEWDTQLGGGSIRAPLSLSEDRLYVHTVQGLVTALNLDTKIRSWQQSLPNVR